MPATESDNGRRIALGAARTALESILRQASPAPSDRSGGGGGEGFPGGGGGGGGGRRREGSGNGSVNDPRKVDELREAIRGAVGILSGLSG